MSTLLADSFWMRSFTGRSGFDETLPVGDGRLEASFRADLEALRIDMEDWFARKFREGFSVKLRALGNDHVYSCLFGANRLIHRANLMQHSDTRGMGGGYEFRGISPEER